MSNRIVSTIVLVLLSSAAFAQTSTQELKRMSLEELLKLDVTTVSRVPETAMTVPAAVFVITQEDIQRSGATSIPEALRLAPGVQVARITAGTWAIGIRGFADRLSRSVLVLIDGRAVYSPLFAGTYWESQDTLLPDIDRIEVIRGPGGTLWGSNAVNGIINIITKAAKDTQGTLVTAGAGSEDRGFGAVRYGGASGSATYRAYLKGISRASEFHPDGDAFDGWGSVQGGVRADWALTNNRVITVEGDAYDGRLGERTSTVSYTTPPFRQTPVLRAPISGGNVLARVAGPAGSRGEFQLQMYYDRSNRREIPVAEDRDTGDVDFQHTFRNWTRHTMTWGAAYRRTSGRISSVAPTVFLPSSRTDNLYSGFFQDEISLVPSRWRITLGAKLEHNDYSGFELQPSGRLLWTPDARNAVWGAVTRAVRTPSRVETDYTTANLVTATPFPTFVRLTPDPGFEPEQLVAYEAGYRVRAAQRVYVTVSAFYNDLRHTLSTELLTPFVETQPSPAHLVMPVDFANGLHGNSQGIEVTSDVRPVSWLRVNANYSYLGVAMSRYPGSHDVSQEKHYEGSIPHHQIQAGSSLDLGPWSVDWLFRAVSDLAQMSVPGYATSGFRVGWRPGRRLELSLVGQDLFHGHHLEWPSGTGANVEVQPSVYGQLTWRR